MKTYVKYRDEPPSKAARATPLFWEMHTESDMRRGSGWMTEEIQAHRQAADPKPTNNETRAAGSQASAQPDTLDLESPSRYSTHLHEKGMRKAEERKRI